MHTPTVNSLNEYIGLLSDELKQGNEYMFRGQSNRESVSSSAARRLNKKAPLTVPLKDFLKYHQNVLKEFRKRKLDIKTNGEILSDLELLGEIQHYEGTTGLIDFTANALVALWFACEASENDTGAVFVYNLTEQADAVAEIEPEQLSDTVLKLLTFQEFQFSDGGERSESSQLQKKTNETPQLWRWIPASTTNKRMSAQFSCFLFGQPGIPDEDFDFCINVPDNRKKYIRDELELFFSMDASRMFSDLAGYAQHGHYYSVSYSSKLRDAFRAFRRRKYIDAIEEFSDVLATEGITTNIKAHALFRRGLSLYIIDEAAAAFEDLNAVINMADKISPKMCANAYGNRGAIYEKQNEFKMAILDFTKVIDARGCPPFLRARAQFYRARTLSERLSPRQYNKAIDDYTQVLKSTCDIPVDLKAQTYIKRAFCWSKTDLPEVQRSANAEADYISVIKIKDAPEDLKNIAKERLEGSPCLSS